MASNDDDGEWVTIQRRKPKVKQTSAPLSRTSAEYGRRAQNGIQKPVQKAAPVASPPTSTSAGNQPVKAQLFRPHAPPSLQHDVDFPSLGEVSAMPKAPTRSRTTANAPSTQPESVKSVQAWSKGTTQKPASVAAARATNPVKASTGAVAGVSRKQSAQSSDEPRKPRSGQVMQLTLFDLIVKAPPPSRPATIAKPSQPNKGKLASAARETVSVSAKGKGAALPTLKTGLVAGKNAKRVGVANQLDSTAPAVRRGKERATPKKKRMSTLRKVILKDRMRRRAEANAQVGCAALPTTDGAVVEESREAGAAPTSALDAASTTDSTVSSEPMSLSISAPGSVKEAVLEPAPGVNAEPEAPEAVSKSAPSVKSEPVAFSTVNSEPQAFAACERNAEPPMTPENQLPSHPDDIAEDQSAHAMVASDEKKRKKKSKGAQAGGDNTSDGTVVGHQPQWAQVGGQRAPDDLELCARRVRDYEYFRRTRLTKGSCAYDNAAKAHTRNFRGYCDQTISGALNTAVRHLLEELVTFQRRKYQQDPQKAVSKRRYFTGLHEVTKATIRRQTRCVIMAPDLENVEAKGGLNEQVRDLIEKCKLNSVSVIFALNRRQLGHAIGAKRPTVVVGIQDYSGANETYAKLLALANDGRVQYQSTMASHTPPCSGACVGEESLTRLIHETLSVAPRGQEELTYTVTAGTMVTYAYTTINNVDTRFGITMKADPEIILVPPKRDFNASGTLTCTDGGELILRWDNSYAATNSKGVEVTLTLQRPIPDDQ